MKNTSQLRDHVHGGTWFDVHGSGDAIVLIHGVGLDHTIWKSQVQSLSKKHLVVTYDMLGHGQSAHPPGARVLGDYVRQLHQLLMNLGIKRATLVGFSMGGLVARHFAAEFPEMTTKLVLLSTVFRRTDFQQAAVLARYEKAKSGETREGIDAAIARWFSSKFQTDHPGEIEKIRTRLLSNDHDAYLSAYQVFASTIDPESLLPIRCPTLVLTGELDSGSTPEMATALSGAIDGSEVLIMKGLKHMVPVEGASTLNTVISNFLDSSSA